MYLFILLCFAQFNCSATAWTTATVGGAFILSNWTDGMSGTPTSFLTPGDTWTVTLPMLLGGSTWQLGTASSSPVTLTLAPGGSLTTPALTMSTLYVYGNVVFNGGTYAATGSGSFKVYGNLTMNSGSISEAVSSGSVGGTIYGNCNVNGGTFNLDGDGGSQFYIYGSYTMTGGSINTTGGWAAMTEFYIWGNFSVSGPSAFTNSSTGSLSEIHLQLPSSSGTMMIHNTSTSPWSLTNVFVRWGCVAQLDGNFNTSNGSPAYGLNVQGTLICPAAYTVNGTGAFTLMGSYGDTSLLIVASPGGINGNITATGTLNFDYGSSYTFNGSVAQVTGTYLPTSLADITFLTIDNAAGVTLSQSTNTWGTLAFVSGKLNTGAYIMSTDGAPGNVIDAGPNSYVNGTLEKLISGYTSVNYEVGDLSYAPMSLTFSALGSGGSLGVKVTSGLHPSIGISGISSTNVANHYWTITNYLATGPASINPKATYYFGDILGGTNASFITRRYASGAWSATMATTNTTSPYTSRPTAAITIGSLAGDYIFGNAFCGTLPITGASSLCTGGTITLSDATPGGTWASGSPSVATVSTTGIVSGISAGVTTISYEVSGCTVSYLVTVTATSTITGAGSLCEGTNISLSDATPGGAWTSSAPFVGSISTTGIVSGLSGGTTTISYTVSGCASATQIVSVNPIAPISGVSSLCAGAVATISDLISGGTWASSGTSIATVGSSGIVNGISAGISTISYSVSGCSVTLSLTVTATASISGPGSLCAGTNVTLSDATPGGIWTSSTSSVAIAGSTGIITAISAGTTNLSYTVTGCFPATMLLTVTAATAPITGSGTLCEGVNSTLSDATPGGTWTSSAPAVGTVSTAGIVSGLSGGTATITYAVSGCPAVTHVVSVNAIAPITGAVSLCVGSTSTLSDIIPSGIWASSTAPVATVGTTGIVNGISAGTSTISYTVSGCTVTLALAVTATATIIGSGSVCAGSSITMSDATPGGTWTSSAPSFAVAGSTGVVTGISAGTTTISYIVSGCTAATMALTVSASTAPITGADSLCQGSDISLADATLGGSWTSSAPLVGSVGTTGIVSGLSGGTTTISYNAFGCPPATTVVTVINLPSDIAGSGILCAGSDIALSDSVAGGTWTSSAPVVGSVDTAGIVSGLSAGTFTISYTLTGCPSATTVFTVNNLPSAIAGASSLCVGSNITLFDSEAGGTWACSAPSVGSVDTTGIVSGLSVGTTFISYTISGCPAATYLITVNALPSAITGPDSLCASTDITLTDATPGGTWASSNISSATISSLGYVTGIGVGTTTISYTVSGCTTSRTLTVIPLSSCVSRLPNTSATGSELKIFPNPNAGNFTFFLSSRTTEKINITITNMTGCTIKNFTTTSNYEQDISLCMHPGVYLLFAKTETERIVAKVVIQ